MPVNDAPAGYTHDNCALCTVAAMFNTTSGQVAQDCGAEAGNQSELVFCNYIDAQMPHPWNERPVGDDANVILQILGIHYYISERAQTNPYTPVNIGNWVNWDQAYAFMQAQPVGTQFAFYGVGLDDRAEPRGGAHWCYAVKTVAGVVFRDYQIDRAGGHGVDDSPNPWAPDEHHFDTTEDLNKYFIIAKPA